MVHSQVRPHPRERRRQETSQRIVDAAERVVREGGFEALTMHQLARRLGYTVGALYRYFPSKEAVVLAVLARVLDALHAELLAAGRRADAHVLRSRGLEPEQAALLRLLAGLGVYEHFASASPRQFRLLSSWLGDTRELSAGSLGALLTPSLLAPTRHLRGLLEAAVAAGALAPGDARRRTALLWGALHGVVQLQRLSRLGIPDFSSAPLAPPLLESLLAAWGADPDSLAELQRRARRLARSPG